MLKYHNKAVCFCVCLLLYVIGFYSFSTIAQAAPNILTKTVLRRIFPTARTYQVKRLLGGFSSPAIWEVVVDYKSPYVVRFSNPYRSLQDQQLEISCLRLAADQGFAPKLYYANSKQGLVVLEKIHKYSFNPHSFSNLASLLKKLHSAKHFPREFDIFSVIGKCIDFLGNEMPSMAIMTAAELPQLEKILKPHKLRAPCHNDLNPTNILFNGSGFKFIDWEMAGQGDPFLDIGTLFNFLITSPEKQISFLEDYWGRSPTSFEQAKIYLMQQVSLAFYGLAYLTVAKIAKDAPLDTVEKRALSSYGTFFSKLPSHIAEGDRRQALKQFAMGLLDNFLQNTKNLRYKEAMEILQKSSGIPYARAS